jgi:hypothetical protein
MILTLGITQGFKNGIGKRVGNEFLIRLNMLEFGFAHALDYAFDHGFCDVLKDAVFEHTEIKRFKN